ncbi:PaaI family thioesterase [Sinimarinibacterium sp. NLF-5-8]|uniref:PaaI family thioesterase n=1 Tax=Sinimarinibacterium sp. NLF-5-8 TaxID=2698684 RepID=UPI00137C10ED|nr:PaaI family thioesterase [Sinimarinibacterium sp. NLF-5-8]QHS09526.1 PaaI family thioesterase [Sinimarinibacterium sp. NLF-5-8]
MSTLIAPPSLIQARRIAQEHGDFNGFVEVVPYAKFLGMRVECQADGERLLRLPYRDELIGNARLPALHGGVTAAFMEMTATLHLLMHLDQHRVPKSIDFSIDYLLSGRPQDCFARCEVSRAGTRVAQTQIRCWQTDPEKPIAIARAHFLLAPLE